MQVRRNPHGIAALGVLAAVPVFAADLAVPSAAAVAALHVVPVLCAGVTGRRGIAVGMLALVVALTLIAGALAPDAFDTVALVGRGAVIASLAIVTWAMHARMRTRERMSRLQSRLDDRDRAADRVRSDLYDSEIQRNDAERRYRAMFNQTFQLVAFLSPEGRIEDVNDTFLYVTGLARDDVVGRDVWSLPLCEDNPDTRQKLRRGVTIAGQGSFFRMEASMGPRRGRSAMVLDISIKPIRDTDGAVEMTILEARDVTEQKAQAEALSRRDRLDVVGQLASGIAHDVNNTLTVISGNLELVSRRLANGGRERRRIEQAIDAVFHGKSLTRRLLAFARRQYLVPAPFALDRLINETCALLDPTLPDDIELECEMADDIWFCWADAGQLQTGLMNLALNARDAMPNGGRLTIRTANFTLHEHDPQLEVPPGDYLLVSVIDNGEGIPPDILDRVMEPYFTTKGPDRGTGMGLSMVYGFVRQSGGDLAIQSRVGQGTEVRLYLPRAARPPDDALNEKGEAGASQVRVLVVEDDASVREVVVGMLEDLGYSTTAVADGAAALKQITGSAPPDLVLTDIMLPGPTDVGDLVAAVRREKANMPIIFSSGMPEEARTRLEVQLTRDNFVAKPYRMAELQEVIARALGHGGG